MLIRNRKKKIVSKARSAHGKKFYGNIAKWAAATKAARTELGLTGFVAMRKDSPLYLKTKELLPGVQPLLPKVRRKAWAETGSQAYYIFVSSVQMIEGV